jgi:hypothetical protein
MEAERILKALLQELVSHRQALRATATNASSSEQLKARVRKKSEEYNNKIRVYVNHRSNVVRKITDAQSKEVQDFINHWSDPRIQSQFCKPSTTLLQYRSIERRRVALADYEGAETIRQVADCLELREAEEAKEKMTEMIRSQFNLLHQKQAIELDGVRSFTERQLRRLQQERDSVIVPLMKAVQKAEQREDRASDVIRAKSARSRREREPNLKVDLIEPAVSGQIYQLRGEIKVRQLKVGEIDVERIVIEELERKQKETSEASSRSGKVRRK